MVNCVQCGQPMEAVEGRNYFRCQTCRTFHFPSPLEASPDHLTPLGDQSGIACPVCHLPLREGMIEGNQILFCEKCRGVLATGPQFSDIVVRLRAKRTLPPDPPVPINSEEYNRQVHCPTCDSLMEVHPHYGPGCVVIDSCSRCHTVWLDHGEIGAIERAPGRRAPVPFA